MLDLASLGAGVLHNRSVEMAKNKADAMAEAAGMTVVKAVWSTVSSKI
jgi:aspartokinase